MSERGTHGAVTLIVARAGAYAFFLMRSFILIQFIEGSKEVKNESFILWISMRNLFAHERDLERRQRSSEESKKRARGEERRVWSRSGTEILFCALILESEFMGSDNAIPGKERTSLRPAKDHPLRGSKNLRSRRLI